MTGFPSSLASESRAGSSNGGFSLVKKVAVAGALALIAVPLIRAITQKAAQKTTRKLARTEDASVDKTVKDSFPASDPPASRYYDIPVNRQ